MIDLVVVIIIALLLLLLQHNKHLHLYHLYHHHKKQQQLIRIIILLLLLFTTISLQQHLQQLPLPTGGILLSIDAFTIQPSLSSKVSYVKSTTLNNTPRCNHHHNNNNRNHNNNHHNFCCCCCLYMSKASLLSSSFAFISSKASSSSILRNHQKKKTNYSFHHRDYHYSPFRTLPSSLLLLTTTTKTTTKTSLSSMSSSSSTTSTTNNNTTDNNRTKLAQYTNNIQECGRLLRQGQLVAFPTETVYGLGGDATNLHAVKSIYTTKGRPYNDPLIVHVLFPYQAYTLWYATTSSYNNTSTTSTNTTTDNTINNNTMNNHNMNTTNTNINIEQLILKTLCESFWPGPLTIVAKATSNALLMTNSTKHDIQQQHEDIQQGQQQQQQQEQQQEQTTHNDNNTAISTTTSSEQSSSSLSLEITNPVLYYVTANTGYIAIRSPRHPIARAILHATSTTTSCDNNDDDSYLDTLPIVAPSANKFGHVSPTLPQHVYTDFLYDNIIIYNSNYNHNDQNHNDNNDSINSDNMNANDISDTNDDNDSSNSHTCDVGVESTVVKVETTINHVNHDVTEQQQHEQHHEQQSKYYTYHVTILRQGAISLQDIKKSLQNANLYHNNNDNNDNQYNNIIVSSNIKQYQHHQQQQRTTSSTMSQTDTTTTISTTNAGIDSNKATASTATNDTTDTATTTTTTTAGEVAPGQSIRHYSPNIPSYLISYECSMKYGTTINEVEINMPQFIKDIFKHVVIIDYGQQLYHWSTLVLQYYDLSCTSNSKEAAYQLFQILRQAEIIPNVQTIYYPQYVTNSKSKSLRQQDKDNNNDTNNDNQINNENMITIVNDTNDKVEDDDDDALTLALQDRLTRAASGIVLYELPYEK